MSSLKKHLLPQLLRCAKLTKISSAISLYKCALPRFLHSVRLALHPQQSLSQRIHDVHFN